MAVGVAGAQLGRQTLDTLSAALQTSLTLAIDSLATVTDSLTLAQQTIADINTGLETVQVTADDVAIALEGSQPMLTTTAVIAGEDLPNSVAAIQAAIPNAAQAAEAIDSTLTTLNSFRIDTSILGFPIQYDLGINYAPTVPFDETVLAIGSSLDDLPPRLAELETSLNDTAVNLQTITTDMHALATDLASINSRLAEFDPMINDFITLVTQANDNLRLIREQMDTQVSSAKTIITLGMIWLVISQLVPIYLGIELLRGRRMAPVQDDTQNP
jgi:hypothetical protein